MTTISTASLKKQIPSRKMIFVLLPALCFLCFVSCRSNHEDETGKGPEKETSLGMSANEKGRLKTLIQSEDLILELTPRLAKIGVSQAQCLTRQTPSVAISELASLQVLRSLETIGTGEKKRRHLEPAISNDVFHTIEWPLSPKSVQADAAKTSNPWQPLEGYFDNVSSTKFGVISAHFLEDGRFEMVTTFSARATRDQKPYGLKAKQTLRWEKKSAGWQLIEWHQDSFHMQSAPHLLFTDQLKKALPDPYSYKLATRSYHDEFLVQLIKKGTIQLSPRKLLSYFTISTTSNHPAVCVVDYNNDGLDDLFITARWGSTQLLHNKGDGTFEDVSWEVGLQAPSGVTCALFADFDNDGDQDVVLGFYLDPIKFYRNDKGRFRVVADSLSPFNGITNVTALSASDLNRDGLLDLYVSTYRPGYIESNLWESHFLTQKQRLRLHHEKLKLAHNHWTNQVGAPNALLLNRGKCAFQRAEPKGADLWRNSYQSAWADYDGDGDDDLYVCNDFAEDTLLRNDTPVGSMVPVFKNVTQATLKGGSIAFGMGVAWGDYDNDGDLDLYVSNMYSKAGKRILKQTDPAIADRVKASAAGNFMYKNEGGVLSLVSGSEPDRQHVNKVGWSFGGQFADFNNDGKMDLYVPSGFYTPPAEIATEVDL